MGEEISVRAHIYNLEGMSAHADRNDIINWLTRIIPKPANIFLVHGEVASAESLSLLISNKLSIPAYIPRYGDVASFEGRSWRISSSPTLPVLVSAAKDLKAVLSELDSTWVEAKQRLENLVAADESKLPMVLSRLTSVRKFVRKTLGDL